MIIKHFTRSLSIPFLALSLFCCADKSDSNDIRYKYELLQEQVNNLQRKVDTLAQAQSARNPGQKNNAGKSKKKISNTAALSNQPASEPTQQLDDADNNNARKSLSIKKTVTHAPKKETRTYTTRVGAICCDGSRSNATGRGACSHHGGVCEWLYQ